MTRSKAKSQPGPSPRAYSDADMAEVLDHPEATDEQLANLRPFAEVFPDLAATLPHARNSRNLPAKRQVSLRLDQDVVERFKADGPGWQGRMGDVLRKAVGL